jgi:hypothetical protein
MHWQYLWKIGLKIALSVLVVVGLGANVYASLDRGSIQGTVTDQQGAVMSGVTVVVTNVATNVAVKLTTNTAGFYLAPELVPGTYSIHIEASGFSPLDITQVTVAGGSQLTQDASMKVGGMTQKVEVTAAAPLVETSASNYSTELQTRTIDEIPLPGRDIQGLVQLIPGLTQSNGPSGSLFGFNSQFGGFPDPLHLVGSGISANGSQSGANAWYLDGSLDAAMGAENMVVNPSPDSVSEFNLVDNGLAAEYGRTSGAVVNVILKSGTNQVHGDTYEFNRNSFFSATNPFARRDATGKPFLQPAINYNDFGGTLGGPIYIPHVYNGKNRTFFFASWDISMLHENKPTILTVPLQNEFGGNFVGDPRFDNVCDQANAPSRCLYDPYSTTGPDANGIFHRTPFPTPVIPSASFDPLATFYLSSFPAPNYLDPLQQGSGGCGDTCNNYIGTVGSSQTTHNISIKVDHEISDHHKLFAEWLFNPSYYTNYRYPWDGATAQTQTGIAGAQPYRTINQVFALGLTSTFGSGFVNEARGMFSRQNQIASQNLDSVADTSNVEKHVAGLNYVLFGPTQLVPDVNVGGIAGFGPQQWQNGIQGVQAYTFLDNVTKIMGKHTLKGGMMFRRDNNWNIASWGFNLNFGGGLTGDPSTGGGAGLAQFLLGAVDQGSGTGTYYEPWTSNDYYGFYAQDDFRVNSKLSLNYGLRWDIFGWFRDRHDQLANLDFTGENPDVPFKGRIDYITTPSHPGRDVFPAQKGSFGPRFAFSYTPFGDRKTVIRAGAGLIYSNGITVAMGTQNGAVSQPAYANWVGYPGDHTGETPAFRMSSGAPAANLPPLDAVKKNDAQFLGTGPQGFLQGDKDPYVIQWSLFVERQLPGNMALSMGYVGTRGMHLYGDEYRSYDYVPTAVKQNLKSNIHNMYPVDASIGAVYGSGTCPTTTSCPGTIAFLPMPQYSNMSINTSPDGFNRYNSFQLKLDKRFSHGLNFMVAYTNQKNIDSANTGSIIGNTATPTTLGRSVGRSSSVAGAASGGVANGGAGGASAEDPDDRRRYVSLAPDDIPQILNLATTYQLPFGKGKAFLSHAGWADKVLGGWNLTQNWNIQSGVPMFFNSAAGDGISSRPNLIGNPAAGRSSKTRQQKETQWFNPNAFEAPYGSDPAMITAATTGYLADGVTPVSTLDSWWTFGNIGTRPPSGRMPAFWNADMTLSKDFHLNEQRYFQFRWELFNALNHQSLGVPNTQWCLNPNADGSTDAIHVFGCQFGKITNVQTDPRSMEFGLKFIW